MSHRAIMIPAEMVSDAACAAETYRNERYATVSCWHSGFASKVTSEMTDEDIEANAPRDMHFDIKRLRDAQRLLDFIRASRA